MNMRNKSLSLMLIAASVVLLAVETASAGDKGFDAVVKGIERHYRARRKKIPFLGVAGFFVKIIRPAGLKEFKLAIYEDQDFEPGSRDTDFENTLRATIGQKWQPMLKSNLRSQASRAYIYSQPDGKDIKLLSVTMERHKAIVVQAKVNPDALMKFMQKPEVMGISLANSAIGSPVLGNKSDTRYTEDLIFSSSDSLRHKDDAGDSEPGGSKPALRARSEEGDRPSQGGPSGEPAPSLADALPKTLDKDVIKLEARLVNLNVKATDRAGHPLSDLKREEFAVLEDGVAQDITHFGPVTAPINLVLLLDLSGSTQDKRKEMIQAAKKFIDQLGPGDEIAIAAFTRKYYVLSEFTGDRDLLKSRVEKIKDIRGGTAYYDAMWKTLDLLGEVKVPRKAIVVLTDGVDNSIARSGYEPTKHTYEEMSGRIAEEEVTIYPIYYDTDPDSFRPKKPRDEAEAKIMAQILEARRRPNELARKQLSEIAEQTAGIFIDTGQEQDIEGAYARVARELHLLYSIAYAPKDLQRDGRFRKVTVRLNRDGAVARTRRGYFAK
jgi:VWFA-related protein